MKKSFFLYLIILGFQMASAQENVFQPQASIKWAPTGLIAGNISIQGEYNFRGKNSLTAKIGIPATITHGFEYEGSDVDFNMRATSFLAGYRTYLSTKQMRGLYLEPYFKYVHHNSEGVGVGNLDNQPVIMNFTNNYNAYGVGAQLGAQFFVGKRFLIDLFFLGPEINSATNTLKAVETSSTLQWTSIEANEAEADIREFIDQFPFIRNRTTIMVDRENKTVRAGFKGALPGFRAGISFGIAL